MTKDKTSFSIDADVLQAAKDAAWLTRVSLSQYVEDALRDYMQRNPPPKTARP